MQLVCQSNTAATHTQFQQFLPLTHSRLGKSRRCDCSKTKKAKEKGALKLETTTEVKNKRRRRRCGARSRRRHPQCYHLNDASVVLGDWVQRGGGINGATLNPADYRTLVLREETAVCAPVCRRRRWRMSSGRERGVVPVVRRDMLHGRGRGRQYRF